MEKKRLKRTASIAAVWLVLLAAVLISSTYAWFSFDNSVNITPMGSAVSSGDMSLLIANSADGKFDKSCTLILDSEPEYLKPMSTADLKSFYADKAQNKDGITILYTDITDRAKEYMMHGRVRLKAENGSCDVFFLRSKLSAGADPQVLAAARLGMIINSSEGIQTYIFRLDELGNTSAASSKATVASIGSVVSEINGDDTAVYVDDPSKAIGGYTAVENSENDPEPLAGSNKLFSLKEGEIAELEFFLYSEGCDENCVTDLMSRQVELQLGFAGVKRE